MAWARRNSNSSDGEICIAWIGAPAALPLLRRTGYLRACAERATVARHGFDWLLPQSAVHWQHVNAALPLGRVGA